MTTVQHFRHRPDCPTDNVRGNRCWAEGFAAGRWCDEQMVRRWTAAGMLNAERSFRRIKGYKQMPHLVDALHLHAHPETASDTQTVGAAT